MSEQPTDTSWWSRVRFQAARAFTLLDSGLEPHEWAPRFWEGSDFFMYLRMLARNRFAVSPRYWHIAAICGASSFTHTCLRWIQRGAYGSLIDKTELSEPPLFVLGHWRTGTTLLHELLMCDPRHTAPDTHACLVPNHILLSSDFFKRYLGFLMPGKRPMDNMAAGWDRPQEEEFALCLMGEPSTYSDIAFPQRMPHDPGALDLSGLSPTQVMHWKRTFLRFVRTLAVRDPRRLVLKSPPHTARIPTLLELFPDARFVTISRDPYVLYASTVNLWRSLIKKHSLQRFHALTRLEEKVFREFRTMYERYLATRQLIPPGRLIEVRYEDLTRDPMGNMETIYRTLQLGDFERVRPHLDRYCQAQKNYETNKYTLTDEQREMIRSRWGDLIEKLGYGNETARGG